MKVPTATTLCAWVIPSSPVNEGLVSMLDVQELLLASSHIWVVPAWWRLQREDMAHEQHGSWTKEYAASNACLYVGDSSITQQLTANMSLQARNRLSLNACLHFENHIALHQLIADTSIRLTDLLMSRQTCMLNTTA